MTTDTAEIPQRAMGVLKRGAAARDHDRGQASLFFLAAHCLLYPSDSLSLLAKCVYIQYSMSIHQKAEPENSRSARGAKTATLSGRLSTTSTTGGPICCLEASAGSAGATAQNSRSPHSPHD